MCRVVGRGGPVTSTRCEDLPVCLMGERLVFLRSFCVVLETGGGVYKINLPEGYSWDGATIPRVWWSIMGHPLKQEFRLASLSSFCNGCPIRDHSSFGIVAPSQE